MPLANAGYGPIVSVGATTHEGALTRQLPELLLELLLDELELEELDDEELEDELEELEELLLEPGRFAVRRPPGADSAASAV